jgi:hypothetical protein
LFPAKALRKVFRGKFMEGWLRIPLQTDPSFRLKLTPYSGETDPLVLLLFSGYYSGELTP